MYPVTTSPNNVFLAALFAAVSKPTSAASLAAVFAPILANVPKKVSKPPPSVAAVIAASAKNS